MKLLSLVTVFILATAMPVLASTHHMSSMMTNVRCSPSNPKVWVNTQTHVYHMQGDKYYGNTAHGVYMCKRSAIAAHNHAAKGSQQ